MNCPTCDNPMVWSDEIGEVWCSVYGTHERWPWPREYERMIEQSNASVRTAIDDRLYTANPQNGGCTHRIHSGLTPVCTSVPQGSALTIEVGGFN